MPILNCDELMEVLREAPGLPAITLSNGSEGVILLLYQYFDPSTGRPTLFARANSH